MATRGTTKTPTRMCKGNKSPILKCIGEVKVTDFYDNWSPFKDGKCDYCKTCVEKMWNYYVDNGMTARATLYYCCQKLDIPFIKEIYERLYNLEQHGDKNGKKKSLTIGSYIIALQQNTTKKEVWDEFSATNVDIADIDTKIESREVKQKQLDNLEIQFGKQDTKEDYLFLVEKYKEYTKGIEFENPQHKDLYIDLCQCRLDKRKIKEGRYTGGETMDNIDKREARKMEILQLDKFESNKPKSITEQILFDKIRFVDSNNVREVYNNPTKDFDLNKIHKYEEDMCLRPLANMLVGHRDFDISMEDIDEYNLD